MWVCVRMYASALWECVRVCQDEYVCMYVCISMYVSVCMYVCAEVCASVSVIVFDV